MTWDNKKPSVITCARLMASPPDVVYRELQEYGAFQLAGLSYSYNEELEKALLNRGDPLIDLGLAEYCGVDAVGANLYQKASSGTPDPHKQAIRIAVIRNQILPRAILSRNKFGVVPDAEVERIAKTAVGEEVNALLTNPSGKNLLAALFNRKSPFDGIPEERLLGLIYVAIRSPSLSDDDSNEFGPDSDASDLSKGVWNLLKTLTVSEASIEAMHWLLVTVDPGRAILLDEDPTPVFNRWSKLEVSDKFKKRHAEPMGRYTSLDFKDEFICLLASLYGIYHSDHKSVHLGSLKDPNPVMRYCAYGTSHYGDRRMSASDLQQAYNRDGEAFIFAALNSRILLQVENARTIVERHMSGPHQIRLYHRRCLQIKKRRSDFNSNPITQWGADLMEDIVPKPSEDHQRIKALETQIDSVSKQVKTVSSLAQWSLIGVVVILVVVLRKWVF